MLIDFRVENFLSIQDEQVFSMVSNNDKSHSNSNTFTHNGFTLLNSSVIYGANSAGKTNLIKAMKRMRDIILLGSKVIVSNKLPITPFLLGDEENKPTKFEINFFIDDIRYQYGFLLNNELVFEEWLYVYEKGNRAQRWFERGYDANTNEPIWYFGSRLSGEKQSWAKQTRNNALFLSTAVNFNSKQLKVVYNWIVHNIKLSNVQGWKDSYAVTLDIYKKDKSEVLKYLKAVDFDIEDVKINKVKLSEKSERLLESAPKIIKNELLKMLDGDEKINKAIFSHKKQNGAIVYFKFDDESDGTQKFFKILGPYLDALNNGYVMVHDELNTHLHPMLTKFIVDLFHDKNINKKNAQLIFTTHETSLLSQNIFRKDQIWFCEKVNKASKFYSLSEFKNIRNINYEKAYFSGNFGGIPYIKDIMVNMGC